MNPHATFGCCLFAASLGMFTFPIVAISMSFYVPPPCVYIPSLFASSHPSPALWHPSSALLFTLFLSRLPFWGPYPRTLLQRLPLPYCRVSLHFPESYISLMLLTCRCQPSTIPSIRPWASDSWSKVLFLLVFSIPAHMAWLSLAVGLCARCTSLNPRRLAVRPLPSSTMTSRLLKGGKLHTKLSQAVAFVITTKAKAVSASSTNPSVL